MTITYICPDCSDTFNKGWATIKKNDESYTLCCYDCYKSNPIIVPTKSVFRAAEDEHVILPMSYQDSNESFQFLSPTEVSDLTSEEYQEYQFGVDEQFLLNPIKSQVHYESITYDKKVSEMEDEFNDVSSGEDSHDDY